MRKKDEDKLAGKALKTINFDKHVLEVLEDRAKKHKTNVSAIVNMVCRQVIMTDIIFYREMQKYHHLKSEEFRFMKEQQESRLQSRIEELKEVER